MFSIPSGDFPLAMMPRASSAATATVDRSPDFLRRKPGEIWSSRRLRPVATRAGRAAATGRFPVASAHASRPGGARSGNTAARVAAVNRAWR
jgi:hypothetical protein